MVKVILKDAPTSSPFQILYTGPNGTEIGCGHISHPKRLIKQMRDNGTIVEVDDQRNYTKLGTKIV
jgi:hypothetical protein